MGGVKEVSFNIRHFDNPASLASRQQRLYDEDDTPSYKELALRRSSMAKYNIGRFYSLMYSGIFGGKPSLHYAHASEEGHNYQPDVVLQSRRGKLDTEIKAFSKNFTGKSICSVPQFENYLFKLLIRLEQSGRNGKLDSAITGFNYGFFRYTLPSRRVIRRGKRAGFYPNGAPKDKKIQDGEPIANLTPARFIKTFGTLTRDLLVVPSNLLIPLLYASRSAFLDQTNGKTNGRTKRYWYVRSGDIAALHDPSQGIEELIERQANRRRLPGVPFDSRSIGDFTPQELLLDRLEMTRRESPKLLLNGKYEVPSFPMTVYEFKTPEDRVKWNKAVQKRHKDLATLLGVRDLYQEAQESPI